MKYIVISFLFLISESFSQNISGRVVNSSLHGLQGKKVEVHLTIDGVYTKFSDSTDASGNFLANSTTDVDLENQLPSGYEISNNFPQPFNPKTIFYISLPRQSQISVDVFTILGERILTIDKKDYPPGNNKLVIELNGFANGVYIARIIIDDQYFVTRKLLLLYGSQHAKETSIVALNKTQSTIYLDSITVSGDAIQRKSILYNQQIVTGNYDVGNIQVDSAFVNVSIIVRKLMEWQQANNQLPNALVNISRQEKITDANGQATFTNIPSGKNKLIITHPEIYNRETILRLENDSTHAEYILDTLNYPEAYMDFYDDVFGRDWPGWGYKSSRWEQQPIFYIVADTTTEPGRWRALQQIAKIDTVLKPAYTTQNYPEGFLKDVQIQIGTNPPEPNTPGYYVIEWRDISPFGGLTSVKTDTTIGIISNAITTYNDLAVSVDMEYLTIHELSSGMSTAGRSNALSSVWNLPAPSWEERNFTESDLKMILYQYSRPPGNKKIDKDDGY